MGRVEMARFRQLATACTDWLIHVNQNGDGSFKDSRSIHCVFEMGQAVVSLLKFGEMEKNQEASDSAVACGEWMLKHQIRSKDKNADGHWTTPEYGKNLIVIPDTIETLRGLLELYRYTRRSQYLRSAFRALEAVKRARPCTDQSRWVSGGGIRARVRMDYDMRTRKYSVCLHRIGDDAIWYLLAKLTGDRALLREFKLQCDEQMKYRHPMAGSTKAITASTTTTSWWPGQGGLSIGLLIRIFTPIRNSRSKSIWTSSLAVVAGWLTGRKKTAPSTRGISPTAMSLTTGLTRLLPPSRLSCGASS